MNLLPHVDDTFPLEDKFPVRRELRYIFHNTSLRFESLGKVVVTSNPCDMRLVFTQYTLLDNPVKILDGYGVLPARATDTRENFLSTSSCV